MTNTTQDHLTALFFAPAEDGSRGMYTVGGFDLRPGGGDTVVHRLVHHHEAQHAILTMETAWGAALLIASRVPRWADLFVEMLDACRLTHESFATYLSCSALAVGFGPQTAALAAYPEYVPLVDRLQRYLALVPGEHRRSLAVTALARVCMQTPILRQLLAAWPAPVRMGSLRAIDRPDERWSVLQRVPGGLPAELITVADAAVAREFGSEPLEADRLGSDNEVLDDKFDDAWARWESVLFTGLADRLTAAGATVLAGNDYLSDAETLVALAASIVPDLNVAVVHDPDVSDQRVVPGILGQMRLWLSELPRPARLITLEDDAKLAEVVRVVDATTGVAGRPNVVLSARLPARVLAGYDFPEADRATLAKFTAPVVAIRHIADDGTGTETDAVWQVRLRAPTDAEMVAAAWRSHGDLTCCVAASCLADERWRTQWLPTLAATAPIVWLLDVGIEVVAGEFTTGRTVQGIYLDLTSTPTGARRALALHVEGTAGVWVAIADDVGIELVTQQVADIPGIDLRMTGNDWGDRLLAVRRALLDLLRTESYLDLRALAEFGG